MKYVSIIILALIVLSCGSDSSIKKPNVFIEKIDMIDLVVDVQILESHYHNLYQRENVYANALDSATFFIFEDHGVTKENFKENLDYYSLQPDTLFSIYEAALDTINNRINSNIKE